MLGWLIPAVNISLSRNDNVHVIELINTMRQDIFNRMAEQIPHHHNQLSMMFPQKMAEFRDNYVSAPQFFNNNRDYVWQGKGNYANGAIVFLPQRHISINLNDPRTFEATLVSQGSVFRSLNENKPKCVFVEDFPTGSVDRFNQTYELAKTSQIYGDRINMAISIALKLSDNTTTLRLPNLLSQDEQKMLIQIGGAGVHCLSSQATDSPTQIYSTLSKEEEKTVNDRKAEFLRKYPDGISGNFIMDNAEKQFIINMREEYALNRIQAAQISSGDPAFLVYGAGHTFIDTFNRPALPALYRKVDPTVPVPAGTIQPPHGFG